ncbi:MAG: LPS assembly protein LptD [Arsenophonus sp. ET-DL9-MAG3]
MIKKNHKILFTIIIFIAVYSQKVNSNLSEQCMLKVPIYTKPIIKNDSNDLLVYINAKHLTSKYPYFIEYKGNVNIQQGNQTLISDKVKLTQKETMTQKSLLYTIVAIGNVYYDNPQIIIKGSKAWLNLNNKDTNIEKANYLMLGRQGRGYANEIKLRGKNRYTILEKGMFTTCHQNNNNWSIIGSKVVLDYKEQVTEIWNARFRIANIPIFYSPYLQLPIGNKRRSGLLLPSGNYSKGSGLNFSLPFYWNIAPNYDASITPQFMTFRGIKLSNEFRYLTISGKGTIAVDWLKNNRSYIKDKNTNEYQTRNNNDRWILYWGHFGILDKVLRFDINYKKVSDSKYFTDFISKYGNSTDSYAIQKFSIGYLQPNWNVTLTYKQFQIFVSSPNSKIYKTKPQLDFNYYKNNLGPFNVKTYAQAAHITSMKTNNPDVKRLHIESEVNFPLSNNWLNMNNAVKVMATYYNQNIPINLIDSKLKKQVTRILPSLSSDAKFFFKRELLIRNNYVQTLEPRVQYLYVPYRDQTNINNYDSSLLKADYNGLFRNYIYSGIDRIASANQLTTGITTRIYNQELTERFNFSVGQIYYFKYPRTSDFNLQIKDKNNTGLLLYASDTYLRLTDKWGLRGGLQYDKRFGDITMGNIITEYRWDSNRLIQLNYRFVDQNYIQATVKNSTAFQKGISQIGAIVNWPIDDHLDFIGSYYYDVKENQPASRLINLKYSTCCWSINIGYERKIVGWQQENFISDHDNKWLVNVELKGLNNNHNFENKDIIANGILPYQRVF